MTKELIRRINLDLLYPPFVERLLNTLAACQSRGKNYWCIEGFRSYATSHRLRMLYLSGKGGRAAPAGFSSHNFGLAVDTALDLDPKRKGLQPSWDHFDVLGEEAQRHGLHWGASYNDKPHISWPTFVSGKDLAPLRKLWKDNPTLDDKERLKLCWAYIDGT